VLLRERNFSQEYSRIGLGNTADLTQTRGNSFPGNHQQHAVADDHRGAFIGKRKLIGQPCRASMPNRRSTATSSSVASKPMAVLVPARSAIRRSVPSPQPDVHEVIAGVEFDGLGDPSVDEARNLFFVPSPKSQIVRVARVLRGLAAIFHVIVGAGDHLCVDSSSPNPETCTTFPRTAETTACRCTGRMAHLGTECPRRDSRVSRPRLNLPFSDPDT